MTQVNIAVMISGGGTNLQALIDAEKSGIIRSGKIQLVLSNKPGAYALTRAENAGIAHKTVEKKDFPSREEYENEMIRILKEYRTDLIVLAGFMDILTPNFIRNYEDRIINIHPSLIPSFCGKGFYGLHVHEAALAKGVKVTGATVHFVNEIPDGGKIIEQKAVRVSEKDTPESLQKKVMRKAEWIILPQAVEKVSRNLLKNK